MACTTLIENTDGKGYPEQARLTRNLDASLRITGCEPSAKGFIAIHADPTDPSLCTLHTRSSSSISKWHPG